MVIAYIAKGLLEHQADFPGVTPERVFVRQYPQGQTGAHLFGYTGEVSQEELDSGLPGVAAGDLVGKGGIEQQYDRFLRGRNGATRVQVDAMGTVRGNPLAIGYINSTIRFTLSPGIIISTPSGSWIVPVMSTVRI